MNKQIALIIFALGIVATAAAYAFSEPVSGTLDLSLTTPLNTGSAVQTKKSGLGLNAGNGPNGLIIYDFTNPGTEKLGIGADDPQAKLHLVGNWAISGAIKPGGLSGKPDDVLVNVIGNQMQWGSVAWLNIQRIDIVQSGACTQIFPSCPSRWNFYADEVSDANCPTVDGTYFGYGATRICYQNF